MFLALAVPAIVLALGAAAGWAFNDLGLIKAAAGARDESGSRMP
jgi:hypothetical protein